jgi:hypothetical protein
MSKVILFSATVLLLLVSVDNAIAEESHLENTLNTKTGFYDWHYSKYEEPGLMNVKSNPLSFSIGMRDETSIRGKNQPTGSGVSYNLEASFGWVKYSGSGTHNHNYYKFLAEGYLPISGTFYGGLGYRYLFDNFGPGSTSTSAGTYDRASTYLYLPIGYNARQADGANLKFQYNYFISGQQTSYISQVPEYLTDLKNDQDSGYGFDISYTAPDGTWETYYRYWSIDDSDISSDVTVAGIIYGYEPKNETSEIGLRFNF